MLIGCLALVALPYFIYPVFLMKILCFALFACSFNLLIGYTGLLSFGHAAFFGAAGYISGYLLRDVGLTFEVAVLIGTLGAGVIGFIMGGLAIRRRGIYFTMITLALAQMVYFVFLQAPFTGGEDGFQNIPRSALLGLLNLSGDITMYYVVVGIVMLSLALIHRIISSPYGNVLAAIRENEARAISLGYDINNYKLLVFVLSAMLAGLAGATKAAVLGFETLADIHWSTSGLVILMTLIGGKGTFTGPLVGAFVIILLENKLGEAGTFLAHLTGIEGFQAIGESITTIIGLIFIVCVLAFRKGIIGELIDKLAQRKAVP
ncbi:branched-chain amino acid ABC transporter permease [Herbaspirillum sp. GCM10030257]|uniref:branched-chain amino acid ABC transporter permease n=1 Tax=Herbaspirillum sp. GCM10030257 TaxID=3273393 RepID=UPI003612C9B8